MPLYATVILIWIAVSLIFLLLFHAGVQRGKAQHKRELLAAGIVPPPDEYL